MCKLNEKFKEWKKWYSEDDNSICAQIRDMLLDAAVFNVINEARKYATTDARGYPELNELIHGLINRSFLKTQTLSIRKLYDERQDVISLQRLINDMKENKAFITRENILSAIELPYNYEEAINEGHRTNNSKMIAEGACSENVHKNVDLLAGVEPAQRQPNDTVRDSVFDQLNKWLDKCKPIVNFVNKIVAHSATEESKGKVPEKDLRISRAKIHKGHGRIVKITAFIGQFLLYESSGWSNFLPVYSGDKFEHFEKPWVKQGDISKLEDFWEKYEKHIERFNKQPERRVFKKMIICENPR
ncbi:MAG: hypothetical protein A2167_03480 [Planctomycetes bacterium RBG_13_46_10]|nr:MAG: hypothetical protein A2167_03480 [Planctomycetes bacterium RBG_13_46_10]